MMGENLSNEVLAKLSETFNSEELKKIKLVLDETYANYEFQKRCTDIIPYYNIYKEVKEFLVCKQIKQLGVSTLKHYAYILGAFIKHMNCDVKTLNTANIRLYLYEYEKSHNVNKQTLDNIRLVLNSFYEWMFLERYIDRNPVAAIERIHFNPKIREPLSQYELELLRFGCNNIKELALLEFLYSTGCRVSEVAKVCISDINFMDKSVKINGKGDKERFVFLSDKALICVEKYLKIRNKNATSNKLFVRTLAPYNGMSVAGIRYLISEIGKRSGINKHIYPHLLRHTFAQHMVDKGADIRIVSGILGHSKLETTQIYAKNNRNLMKMDHQKYIS